MEVLIIKNSIINTIYDEELVNKSINDIVNIYFPELKLLHDKLEKELKNMFGILDKDINYIREVLIKFTEIEEGIIFGSISYSIFF